MALHVGCRAAKWKKEKKKIPTRKREWSLGSEYLERTGGDGPNSKLYANQIEFILDWYLCLYFHSLRGTHLDTLTDSVIRSVLLPVGGIENTSMQSWCDGVHCLSISSSVFRTSGNWKWYSSGSQMRSGASGTFDSGCTQAHRGESTRVFFFSLLCRCDAIVWFPAKYEYEHRAVVSRCVSVCCACSMTEKSHARHK